MIKNFAQKNFTPLSNKKFYFFHGRNQIGEELLANYFHSHGYEIISPATLPLDEQINILANCESFASSLGSIAHNTLFAKDGTHSIFIPRYGNHNLNPYQNMINDLRKLNVAYIDTTLSIYAVGANGTYCYIISKQLKEYFGDDWNGEYSEQDFISFLNYAVYTHNAKEETNQEFQENSQKYYAPIIGEFIEQLKKREDLLQKFGVNIN